MIGPPGAGKSMLAQRLPGLLPPLDAREALEISMVQSLAGELHDGAISPHAAVPQSASFRLDGGAGRRRPEGEAGRSVAGASGRAVSGRAAGIPARRAGFAAPADRDRRGGGGARQCACALSGALPAGRGDEPVPLRLSQRSGAGCGRAPKCAGDYQSRISGPLFDRIDMHVEVQGVTAADLALAAARGRQRRGRRARRRGARTSSASASKATASAPMPKPKANCWTRSPRRMRRAPSC